MTWTNETVRTYQEQVRHWTPGELLRWAWETWGDGLTLASSFGLEDVALIDMAARVFQPVDVFCLDTDLLFPETYRLMETLVQRYPIRLRRVRPRLTLEEQAAQEGPELWRRDPDRCCGLRKVEPLGRALAGYAAWVTGIRREQAPTRAHAEPLEWDARHNLVKLNPLAYWTTDAVWAYVRAEAVPYNPLHDRGYPSIGCWPCTRAVAPGEDPRAGRWSGFDKTECGIHGGPAR
ncbi:MAG: phosphoadenylyl-sulfate reductase [Actinomycetia bacterium]|nr:phosphoadenylyl-sulfate reductase [Actinomycetes bacterium]